MPTKKLSGLKSLQSISILYFTPAFFWGVFILYFSLLPGDRVPSLLLSVNDKLVHSLIYFISAGLIYFGFIRYNLNNAISRAAIVTTIVLCLTFGAAIELLQHYLVSNRHGDWFDFVANSAGSVACVLVLVLIHRLKA